jgi:hypothetical protein
MNVSPIDRNRRMVAAAEEARLKDFLAAAQAVKDARAAHAAFDTAPELDCAAARDALDACLMAEDRLLALASDAGLATFLARILEQLTAIAGEPACA